METDPCRRRPTAARRAVGPAESVAEILKFLLSFAAVEEPLAGDVPADLVRHGVRTADLLAVEHPGDIELQVAGLLHDVGLLLVPGDEIGHPRHGASYTGDLFGGRCAELIARHVDAQRYLERTVSGYTVAPPPTAEFAEQATAMTAAEAEAFEAHPLFTSLIALRRADDRADGTPGGRPAGAPSTPADLHRWAALMDRLAKQAETARPRPTKAPD